MARPQSRYVCQACGEAFLRWEGQCRACGGWNSLVEQIVREARRPAGRGVGAAAPVVAAWSVLRYLGRAGYERVTARTLAVKKRLISGIRAIPDLQIVGHPDAAHFFVCSPEIDVYAIEEELTLRAWVTEDVGRRIVAKATCHAGDLLTAEAEALFIRVDFTEVQSRMAARRDPSPNPSGA